MISARKLAPIALLLACGTWGCQGRIARPGESKTVQGCLGNDGGNYTLTDDYGRVYQLDGKKSELGKHVGEQVLVRGEQVTSSNGPEAPAEATSQGVPTRLVVTSTTFTSQKCGPAK